MTAGGDIKRVTGEIWHLTCFTQVLCDGERWYDDVEDKKMPFESV